MIMKIATKRRLKLIKPANIKKLKDKIKKLKNQRIKPTPSKLQTILKSHITKDLIKAQPN
jgi:hypothetical protein